MKYVKKFTALILMSVLLFYCFSFAGFSATDSAVKKSAGFTESDFLHTEGKYLVNENGEKVVLKGVNLGAWLIFEDWLCPYEEVSDNYEVITVLEERFGTQKAYELLNTYYDNTVTEYDLDCIKEMGFNCVRIPFWFRNFYYDDNGTKILDDNGEWDFSRLDWAVNSCFERGLYVILDMHGAVGYQSDAPHSGKGKSCGLIEKNEKGERYRELTDELWTAIATRYRGNPAVAMYDLLNEPMCDVECTELERRQTNEAEYSRLYDTVRKADPEHIITLECIWTMFALPHKALKNWTNVVYQVHFYQNSDFIFNLFVFLTRLYFFNTPLLMGEFYPHKTTTWKNCFNTMDKYGFNWMLWTYKATGHLMWSSDWCLKGSKDGFERAKIKSDSFDEIKRKWGECQRTEIGFQDTGHYDKNVKANLNF